MSKKYKDTKAWNPFVGCNYECFYCKPSYQNIVAWNGRMRGCHDCQNYKPHEHPERLNRMPSDKAIFVCSNGDITFSRKGFTKKVFQAMSARALIVDVLEKQYTAAVADKKDSQRLFLVHAVLYLAKSPKSRIVDNLLNVVYNDEERLEIPDYALDMHTYRGKKMVRGLDHFFAEGSKLKNQAIEDPYEKEAFEALKKKKKT